MGSEESLKNTESSCIQETKRKIVKQLTGKGKKQKSAVKSKDGELLKSKEGRFARWKEHFKKVLNKEISESPPQPSRGAGTENRERS